MSLSASTAATIETSAGSAELISTGHNGPAPSDSAGAQPPLRKSKGPSHIPALDGLRGLAILLVIGFHFTPTRTPFTGIRLSLFHLPAAGWVGVDLFFVLSGFLITSILYDAKPTHGYFRNFYMRRVLRIFPLYYGVLLATFGVVPILFAPAAPQFQVIRQHQFWLWAYLTNFIAIDWKWFSHCWSLAVEEQYYLIWPAIVFLLNRRTLMGVCIGMMVAALGIRIGRAVSHCDLQATYYYTFCRMDALAAGALLALASRSGRGVHGLMKFARITGPVSAVLLVGLYVWNGETFSFMDPHWRIPTVGFSLLAVFFASILVWAIVTPASSGAGRVFTSPVLRFFGKYSYGLYVLHGLLHPWIETVSAGPSDGGGDAESNSNRASIYRRDVDPTRGRYRHCLVWSDAELEPV